MQDSTSLATDTRGEATQRAPKYRVVLDVELSHVPDLARCANKSGSKTHVSIHIRYNNTGIEIKSNSAKILGVVRSSIALNETVVAVVTVNKPDSIMIH